jgi:hypothetical protein
MSPRSWKYPAAQISDKAEGPFPLRLVRLALMELQGATGQLDSDITTIVGSPGAAGATVLQVRWQANGPFIVDTDVDGAWVAAKSMTIDAVYLYRTTPGTSGSTILDLNRNGVTMYATQGNRPTIPFGSLIVHAALPDFRAVAVGDVLTVDTDQIEAGSPADWSLIVEGS